jgi:hypothetical protein
MATGSNYDGEVQMYVERPREIDLGHLRFLRWLAVRGYLEHAPAGRSYGVYARDAAVPAQTDAVRRGTAPTHPQCSDLTGSIDPDTEEHLQ